MQRKSPQLSPSRGPGTPYGYCFRSLATFAYPAPHDFCIDVGGKWQNPRGLVRVGTFTNRLAPNCHRVVVQRPRLSPEGNRPVGPVPRGLPPRILERPPPDPDCALRPLAASAAAARHPAISSWRFAGTRRKVIDWYERLRG